MARLPQIRRLSIEDYQDQKSWIGKLLTPLNQFLDATVSALNKDLNVVDNTTSDIKSIQLSSVPTLNAPASVSWTKVIIPIAVMVGNIRLSSGANVSLSAAVQVQWQMSPDNKSLQIINVVGVTPTSSSQYILTLICIAG